jgi:hypothetical protein
MKSKVYFADIRVRKAEENKINKIKKLFDMTGFNDFIKEEDLVAIKVHVGDRGNDAYVNPIFVRAIVDKIKEIGAKSFITDTNTLYSGSRYNAVEHILTAIEHGFNHLVVNAPFIVADGLKGKNFVEIEIDKRHFKRVKIASDIFHTDSMIVVTHFKGHGMTGFGGAIKNLGMGCASQEGKEEQHSGAKPIINVKICIGCQKCVSVCPKSAISMRNEKANIDYNLCTGCGQCIVNCPVSAIDFDWKKGIPVFIERVVEYACGAIKNKSNRVGYFNFLIDIVPDCDCIPWSDASIVPDIGILASDDPVAIDKASYDLVNRERGFRNSFLKKNFEQGRDKFKGIWEKVDATIQFRYGEKIGLGNEEYELIEV